METTIAAIAQQIFSARTSAPVCYRVTLVK